MNPLSQFGINIDNYSKDKASITALANSIARRLAPYATRITIAGSIRRGVNPSDIDIVLIPKNKERLKQAISAMGGSIWSSGEQQIYFKYKGVDVNIYYATSQNYGAQLMTRTGPREGNIGNRTLAKNQGLTLNQYGLFKGDKLIAGKTEREIYTGLGKPYKPPAERGK